MNHPAAKREPMRIEVYVPAERRRAVVYAPDRNPSRPVYAPSGHLLYEAAGTIWRVPFSLDRLAVEGEPVRVAADAREPSASGDGAGHRKPVLTVVLSLLLLWPSAAQVPAQSAAPDWSRFLFAGSAGAETAWLTVITNWPGFAAPTGGAKRPISR